MDCSLNTLPYTCHTCFNALGNEVDDAMMWVMWQSLILLILQWSHISRSTSLNIRMIASFHDNMTDSVRGITFRPISNTKQSKTRVCPSPNSLRCALLTAVAIRTMSRMTASYFIPCTRSDSSLFNLLCLESKKRMCRVLIRHMLFADSPMPPLLLTRRQLSTFK